MRRFLIPAFLDVDPAGGAADGEAVERYVQQLPSEPFILFVGALPKTRSAKIVRRAVRATAVGADPGDLSSLENPETLAEIEAAVSATPSA